MLRQAVSSKGNPTTTPTHATGGRGRSLFAAHRFDAVMHFASFIQVGESVREPARYYRNNLVNSQNLLDAMLAHDVRRFVFSSTAALFGEPSRVPIDETLPSAPINPYGRSKWMVEQILSDYEQAYGFEAVCLRYFNAAGADPEGELGERHDPETHLIPLVLQAAAISELATIMTDAWTWDRQRSASPAISRPLVPRPRQTSATCRARSPLRRR